MLGPNILYFLFLQVLAFLDYTHLKYFLMLTKLYLCIYFKLENIKP